MRTGTVGPRGSAAGSADQATHNRQKAADVVGLRLQRVLDGRFAANAMGMLWRVNGGATRGDASVVFHRVAGASVAARQRGSAAARPARWSKPPQSPEGGRCGGLAAVTCRGWPHRGQCGVRAAATRRGWLDCGQCGRRRGWPNGGQCGVRAAWRALDRCAKTVSPLRRRSRRFGGTGGAGRHIDAERRDSDGAAEGGTKNSIARGESSGGARAVRPRRSGDGSD